MADQPPPCLMVMDLGIESGEEATFVVSSQETYDQAYGYLYTMSSLIEDGATKSGRIVMQGYVMHKWFFYTGSEKLAEATLKGWRDQFAAWW